MLDWGSLPYYLLRSQLAEWGREIWKLFQLWLVSWIIIGALEPSGSGLRPGQCDYRYTRWLSLPCRFRCDHVTESWLLEWEQQEQSTQLRDMGYMYALPCEILTPFSPQPANTKSWLWEGLEDGSCLGPGMTWCSTAHLLFHPCCLCCVRLRYGQNVLLCQVTELWGLCCSITCAHKSLSASVSSPVNWGK